MSGTLLDGLLLGACLAAAVIWLINIRNDMRND